MISVLIRPETPADIASVFAVHAAAFETDAEARLVNAIREAGGATVSLVAEQDGEVVGHILFSPVTLENASSTLHFTGLAPVGVLPSHQRHGIGGRLIHAGLEECRKLGIGGCVLLGDPGYYSRFGFQAAATHGLRCVYDAPPEAFQALELTPGAFHGLSGTVHYHPAFSMFE